ncbi:hypothetical protein [Psittacicella gerlachiana]|uniref:Porin n=1 Tax=Psittacicella gerlachiana TaxID=2028574 RepID=A0A3A1YDG3_9GAMM|nr:hypothetical protein [Psittacicella gerlachiana]RIY35289.1 hypothetical protein CKF59_03810 [Psittacicella gerlachiana]
MQMKKTLVAMLMASIASCSWAKTNVYSSDEGSFYIDGELRYYHSDFDVQAFSKSANASKYSLTSRYRNFIQDNLRLRFAVGADARLGEKGKGGFYLRYQDQFYSAKYYSETTSTSTFTKAHDSEHPAITVASFYFSYLDYGRLTVGVRGEKDAVEYYQYLPPVDIVQRNRSAFDLVNKLADYDDNSGYDKRTLRYDLTFGQAQEHYLSLSYTDTKTGSSTTYYNQYGAVYGYQGVTDLKLQLLVSAGHYNGYGANPNQNSWSSDVEAYYQFSPTFTGVASLGYAKNQTRQTLTSTYVVGNLAASYSPSTYFTTTLGYSYHHRTNKGVTNSSSNSKTDSHTLYTRVASEVYTYKTTAVELGVEASYRRELTKMQVSKNKSKSVSKRYAAYVKYNF